MKREAALAQMRSLVHDIPEIGLDSIVHIIQNLSPAQRSEVAKVIGRLDGANVTTSSSAPVTATPVIFPLENASTISESSD